MTKKDTFKKTFWSVKFAVWGSDRLHERWFESKEKAKSFANKDYCDNPVRHTFTNPQKISEIEEVIEMQEDD